MTKKYYVAQVDAGIEVGAWTILSPEGVDTLEEAIKDMEECQKLNNWTGLAVVSYDGEKWDDEEYCDKF